MSPLLQTSLKTDLSRCTPPLSLLCLFLVRLQQTPAPYRIASLLPANSGALPPEHAQRKVFSQKTYSVGLRAILPSLASRLHGSAKSNRTRSVWSLQSTTHIQKGSCRCAATHSKKIRVNFGDCTRQNHAENDPLSDQSLEVGQQCPRTMSCDSCQKPFVTRRTHHNISCVRCYQETYGNCVRDMVVGGANNAPKAVLKEPRSAAGENQHYNNNLCAPRSLVPQWRIYNFRKRLCEETARATCRSRQSACYTTCKQHELMCLTHDASTNSSMKCTLRVKSSLYNLGSSSLVRIAPRVFLRRQVRSRIAGEAEWDVDSSPGCKRIDSLTVELWPQGLHCDLPWAFWMARDTPLQLLLLKPCDLPLHKKAEKKPQSKTSSRRGVPGPQMARASCDFQCWWGWHTCREFLPASKKKAFSDAPALTWCAQEP